MEANQTFRAIRVVWLPLEQAFPKGDRGNRPTLGDVLNKAHEEGYLSRAHGNAAGGVWVELIHVSVLMAIYGGETVKVEEYPTPGKSEAGLTGTSEKVEVQSK